MTLLWMVCVGFAGWGVIAWQVERLTVSAWRGKVAYRTLSLLFAMLLVGAVYRGIQYHTELVITLHQLKACQ